MRNPENFHATCKWLFGIDVVPFQNVVLRLLWKYKFPMLLGSRGCSKSFILGLYSLLRAIWHQGSKVVICGASFRQSKFVFEYMEGMYKKSNVLQSIIGGNKFEGPKRDIDKWTFYIGNSEVISLPIGDGGTIRGMRANYIIADEFQSIPRDIFEVVIKGFGAVSESPSERVKNYSKIKALKDLSNIEIYKDLNLMGLADDVQESTGFGNQTVLSGTAYYTFNHLYQYWRKYKGIVNSGGDKRILEEIFQGEIPINFSWKDYCVIRIPYTKVPIGFLDEDQIAQAKATVDRSTFLMEYGAVFPNDSEGFFKRTLLEKATCKPPIMLPSGPVEFSASLSGSPAKNYVIGIDPASEKDNFAIVVLEICPDHRRIVYSWTVNRAKMREKLLKGGKNVQTGFYSYCAAKIRELCKKFPTTHIGMDSQGGGIAVMEALRETETLSPGELPILPYIKNGDDDPFWWEIAEKPTDGEPGLHYLHLVNFASADFTGKANHGMRMDFESQNLIFPFFDSLTLGESYKDDKITNRDSDTLEDCVLEIEELKSELTTIIITETSTGRDHWDTPDIKLPGGKKGRVRKDRYSALLIANMIARHINLTYNVPQYNFAAGYVGDPKSKKYVSKTMYVGPDNLVSKMTGSYGAGVIRR
jgi:hypothetical protein